MINIEIKEFKMIIETETAKLEKIWKLKTSLSIARNVGRKQLQI